AHQRRITVDIAVKQLDFFSIVHHPFAPLGMRPVGAPDRAVGRRLDECFSIGKPRRPSLSPFESRDYHWTPSSTNSPASHVEYPTDHRPVHPPSNPTWPQCSMTIGTSLIERNRSELSSKSSPRTCNRACQPNSLRRAIERLTSASR